MSKAALKNKKKREAIFTRAEKYVKEYRDSEREMGAEDFSYMLDARPGCYLFIGQGDTASVHHPAYDFNDSVSPIGASFFARLVERAQPVAR